MAINLIDFLFVVIGFFAGLVVNISVGPVNLYVIRRALAFGFWASLASGMGALLADLIFAGTAALGAGAIASLLQENIIEVKILGGTLFFAYGLSMIVKKPEPLTNEAESSAANLVGGVVTGFFMTIANPAGLVWFGAFYAGGASLVKSLSGSEFGVFQSYLILLGTLGGLGAWWLILSLFAARLRYRIKMNAFNYVTIGLGLLILAVGLYFMIDGIADLFPEESPNDFSAIMENVQNETVRFFSDNFGDWWP